jgi:hypothetical protein
VKDPQNLEKEGRKYPNFLKRLGRLACTLKAHILGLHSCLFKQRSTSKVNQHLTSSPCKNPGQKNTFSSHSCPIHNLTTVVTYVLTISQASSYLVATKCLPYLSTYLYSNLLHSLPTYI